MPLMWKHLSVTKGSGPNINYGDLTFVKTPQSEEPLTRALGHQKCNLSGQPPPTYDTTLGVIPLETLDTDNVEHLEEDM